MLKVGNAQEYSLYFFSDGVERMDKIRVRKNQQLYPLNHYAYDAMQFFRLLIS